MGSVYASRAELDQWVRGRNLRRGPENGKDAPSSDPPSPLPNPAIPAVRSRRWKVVSLSAAAAASLAIVVALWLRTTEYFWKSPITDAKFQTVTDLGDVDEAAAVSRDGHFAAFLSDRDGRMDVWVTQVGSGLFHNLTRGSAPRAH